MKSLAGALLLSAALLPVSLHGQGMQFTVGGIAAQQTVQSHVDPASDRFGGLVLGAEGALVSDRLMVRLRYGEGRINPKAGSTLEPRDVVEGEALLGLRAMPWLTLWLGPSARAYTTNNGDERWLSWSGRASARGALFPGRMQTFVELWGVLSGNVGDPPIKVSGRGANGGLEMRLGEAASFWGRLGYRIESLHAQGLRETVESLTLSVIYGLPQKLAV
jgi:hypothetical protein